MALETGSPDLAKHRLGVVAWATLTTQNDPCVVLLRRLIFASKSLGVSNLLLPRQGLGDGVQQSLLSPAGHVDGSPHSSR